MNSFRGLLRRPDIVKCGTDELEDGEVKTTIFKSKEQDGGDGDQNRTSQILGQYQTITDACN